MDNLDTLVAGFKRFHQRYYQTDQTLFARLKSGQQPGVLIIGCSDSRIDPALLTESAPGDLLVVRNVANLVPSYAPDVDCHSLGAAVEYAVNSLGVAHIVVLGHSQCGGIQALINGLDNNAPESSVGKWVSHAGAVRDAVLKDNPDKTPEEQARICEQASVVASLENLATYPWVKHGLSNATLQIHGWYFDLQVGELLGWSSDTDNFDPLVGR